MTYFNIDLVLVNFFLTWWVFRYYFEEDNNNTNLFCVRAQSNIDLFVFGEEKVSFLWCGYMNEAAEAAWLSGWAWSSGPLHRAFLPDCFILNFSIFHFNLFVVLQHKILLFQSIPNWLANPVLCYVYQIKCNTELAIIQLIIERTWVENALCNSIWWQKHCRESSAQLSSVYALQSALTFV